jgi:protein ImuB
MMRLAYIHLPRFPVQRKVVECPALAGQPFVLTEETQNVRRVVFASTAAGRVGIRPGMTATSATALLHTLREFTFVPQQEVQALTSLGEALMAVAPGFQLAAPDGLYLDASAALLSGGEESWALRIGNLVQAHGYRGQVAVASQMFTARAVARCLKSPGALIPSSDGAQALASLPLRVLDTADPAALNALQGLGFSRLGEVAELPPGALVARLGAAGLRLHRLCRGEDDALFRATPLEAKVEERLDLDWPVETLEPLLFALKTTLDRACARLRARRQAAVKLSFVLKLDPSGEVRVGMSLSRPSSLPKLLLELAKQRIADLTVQDPIGAVGVCVDESCEDRGQQLTLGDQPEGDAALEVVLSRLATRLGEEVLFCAQLKASHRPEHAYGTAPFSPPRRDGELWARTRHVAGPASGDPLCLEKVWRERPSRIFAAPTPLKDAEVFEGDLRSARLLGKHREAVHMTGPERLQGEWWSDVPYARDYYRVVFEGLGPVWVYRDGKDGRFYLHGMFD